MEVEIERFPSEEIVLRHRAVPGRQQGGGASVIQARGILAQVALLRDRVKTTEQRQTGIGDECHHMAFALDRPQLQCQSGAQRVSRRNHDRARQASRIGQGVHLKANKFWQEQEESAAAGHELSAGNQREGPRIGYRFHGGRDARRPFLVQTSRQGGEAFLAQQLPHRRRT